MDLLRVFQSFLEKFYLSPKTLSLTSDSSQESSQNPQTLHHSSDGWCFGVYFSVLYSVVGKWVWPLGLYCPNLQSSLHFSHWWLIFGDIGGTKTVWVLTLMKDPSALSSINVNKYFPQPRSIRIKDGKKRQTEERGKINWSRALLKRGWGGMVVGEKGVEGKKKKRRGLSGWVNNEACFQCFKGRGEKA